MEHPQVVGHDAEEGHGGSHGGEEIHQPRRALRDGLQGVGVPDEDPAVDGDMELVARAGGVEDGVLHRAEELHALGLPDAQHRPGETVELGFLHLLPLELLPPAAHGDEGPGGHSQMDAPLLHAP